MIQWRLDRQKTAHTCLSVTFCTWIRCHCDTKEQSKTIGARQCTGSVCRYGYPKELSHLPVDWVLVECLPSLLATQSGTYSRCLKKPRRIGRGLESSRQRVEEKTWRRECKFSNRFDCKLDRAFPVCAQTAWTRGKQCTKLLSWQT